MIIVNKQFNELKYTKKNRLLYKRLFTFTIIGLRYWMRKEVFKMSNYDYVV